MLSKKGNIKKNRCSIVASEFSHPLNASRVAVEFDNFDLYVYVSKVKIYHKKVPQREILLSTETI
jgi:hypothetical protein